jgi:small GTP-binding protein
MFYHKKSIIDYDPTKKPYKICMVGDSGNGKSSIINKFINNEFSYSSSGTIGVDYRTKIIDVKGKKYKFGIWDTAGQERFRSIVSSYLKNVDGIILSFDMTNYQSFLNLELWMRDIKQACDINEISLILIGTKRDLIYDTQHANFFSNTKYIQTNDIDNFLEKYQLKYFETSARHGTNIDNLFNAFAEQIIEKRNKFFEKNNPSTKPLLCTNRNESKSNKNCCFY